jgi:hypothetical protein
MNKYLNKIKSVLKKIVNFYVEPYSGIDIKIQEKEGGTYKEAPKKKRRAGKEISGETTYDIFIDYYKKNILSVFAQIIMSLIIVLGVSLIVLFFLKISIFSQIWALVLIGTIIGYSIIKPGLYYLFERKKEITNGLFSMVSDYVENSDNVSFKNYVENLDDSRYPRIFIDEFLNPMKKLMQTTYSEGAIKEELNLPRNNYYEIEKYKDFIIKAIASNDQSIRKTLKIAIDTSKESKKAYVDKMKTTGFIIYLAIGLALLFPAVFIGIFISTLSGAGLAGITTATMLPTALTFNLWFITVVLSSTSLMIGVKYYTGDEGKAVIQGQYGLIGLTIASILIYAVIMTL